MHGDPRAVLITGLFGTGKRSVATEIADVLETRELPYAVVDLDWLCWGWAGGAEGSEHRMMLANLVPIVANYLEAGVRTSSSREASGPGRSSTACDRRCPCRSRSSSRSCRSPRASSASRPTSRPHDRTICAMRRPGSRPETVSVWATCRSGTTARCAVASDILHRLGWTEQDYHRGGGEE